MTKLHRTPRNDAGYTLIELLVVLTLAAIVAALAQPAMGGYIGQQKTRRALDQLSGDIAMARIMAVRSGDRTVLEVTDPSSYRIWVESSPADTVRRVSLATDYAGVQLQAPQGRLEFNARGLLLTGAGSLIASLGSAVDTVNITSAGRVYRAY